MPFLMQKSFLAILLAMLISRKPVQTRGICEKCGFFATRRPSPKGERKLPICFELAFFLIKKSNLPIAAQKQVCNVKNKNLLCLINVKGNFLI